MAHLLTLVLVFCAGLSAREAKENDKDVNYDEGRVPAYDLPSALVSSSGKPIQTAGEWRAIRRPEILALFSNLIYGRVPVPVSPIRTEFEVVKEDPDFMGGQGDPQGCKDPDQQ